MAHALLLLWLFAAIDLHAAVPAYPAPNGGWTYLYQGTNIASSPTTALDGTWNRDTGSDSWSGDGRGPGNGLPGGLSVTNGILTIEDAVTTTTGGTFNNRRYNFTRNLAQDPGLTNANTLLDDGVTLTFRARLTPATDPLLELTNAPNGYINNSDGKGIFGIRQAGSTGGSGGQLIGFSLNQAIEDTTTTTTYNFGQAGLHLNQLNGNTRTNNVDPGEPGTPNLLPLDPATFHEFWITIQDNATDPGTHRVSIFLDGSLVSTVFNVTAGTGSDGPATNYLSLALGSTAQRAAVDIDFFGYRAGVIAPNAYNQPIGIQTPPADQNVAPGQLATFNVALTGTPPYTIQWYRDGAPVSGATNTTYITAPVTSADEAAHFTVVVANAFNTLTSAPPAELHLLGPPIITAQPVSLTVTNGDPAALILQVSSTVSPTYQWHFNGTPMANQTNATLNFAPATPANAGAYQAIVANNSGTVTSLLATLTVIVFDYGDAPDSGYQTLRANDGARHRVINGIHLGATIDVDPDGLASPLADGDDTTGTDDEDGVNFLTPWVAGQPATVQIIASTNGFLSAWVDWQHDASWQNPGDQIYTNLPVLPGTNTLTLQIPDAALAGSGYARFRFATTGPLNSFGPVADGEVEDYLINVTPRADLAVTLALSANPTNPVPVNTPITYTITLTNHGPSLATTVRLTNDIPASVDFISVTTTQGSCYQTGDQVICDLGTLGLSSFATVTLTLRPTASGPLVLTTQASSATADPVPLNNTATLTLTALEAPAITVQPLSQTVTNGSTAVLTVAATGAAPLRYQWHFGGLPLAGQTNSTLSLPATTPANEGTYTLRITNLVGTVDSAGATLTVLTPPAVLTQPASRTNLAGSTATFAVTATGSEPLHYQWRYNNTNLLAGEDSPSLTLADVRLTNAGVYSVTISNQAGAITSAPAALTVIEMDFGDAPTGYPTALAENGARHRLTPGIRLGAAIDFEPDTRNTEPGAGNSATGDDAAGIDDEDGVLFHTPLRTGQSVSLTVTASTNGFLNAWLDFNRNTNWSEFGEQIFVNRSIVAGTNLLSFIVAPGASSGTTFARFRFSTISGLSFVGEAANGEVEDYALTIEAAADISILSVTQINPVAVGSSQIYLITVSNAGPVVATGVSLSDTLPVGLTFLSASASQGGCTFSAGTVVCALGSLNAGGIASITLTGAVGIEGTTVNSATAGANQVDVNAANNTAVTTGLALVPPGIVAPPASQSVSSGGTANFNVATTGTNLRYQWRRNGTDLPGATFPSFTIASVQPSDAGSYSVRLTNEVGVAVSTSADLSVLLPVTFTTQPQSLTTLAGSNVTLSVSVSGTGPFSYQWEFNASDLLGQTGASLVLNNVQTNQAGAYQVRVSNVLGTVPSSVANLTVLLAPMFTLQPQGQTNPTGSSVTFTAAVIGTEPMRQQWYFNRTNALALQTNSSLTLTALLTNQSGNYSLVASNITGSVTSIVASLAVYAMDFGDAPQASGYPTTLAFNGARHRVVAGWRLGASIDAETNGLASATATGDDLSGVDDEDGVTFPASLLVGQTAAVSIVASAGGFIDAWLDFNGNGAWNDPGEQILMSWPVVAGTNVVPMSIPAGAAVGSRFARFRFSSGGGLSFDGFAPDGEVEDYQVTLQPTVDLALGIVDSLDPVPVSSNFTYTISVTNRGPSRADLVWVTNALPPSFTFISAATSGGQGFCDVAGSIVYCLLDDMPGGVWASIELTVRASATGSFTNRAWAFSIAGAVEATPANNTNTQSTTVVGAPVTYGNGSPIAVADAAVGVPGKGAPYPSSIVVSGVTSALYRVTVGISNMTHAFAKDFDILLVGPRGQNVLLMSDAGGAGLAGVNLTFDDAAADPLPGAGVILSGTYRPGNFGASLDIFPAPAPVGPFGSTLSLFNGTDPNGAWSLYVVDGIVGGLGTIQGGWTLQLTTADPIADLAVSVLRGTDPVALGSNLVYTVALTNRGPAVAAGVRLTNALPVGMTLLNAAASSGSCMNNAGLVVCDFNTLVAGAGVSVTFTLQPTLAGSFTNSIRAFATQLDPVPTNDMAQFITVVRVATDLTVTQVPSTNLVLLGQPLTYTLLVTNRGPNMATTVRLLDVFPATASFGSAVASQGGCMNVGGVVDCALGSLAPGARTQVALKVFPNLIGVISNTVSVASDEIDSLASNNTAVLVQSATVAADLSLLLANGQGPMTNVQGIVGGLLTFNVVVTNRGPSSAPGATLTNVLPPGFQFVSGTSTIGNCEVLNGVVLCSLVSLDAEASAGLALVVRATVAGVYTNVFKVGADSVDFVPTNNEASVFVEVRQPPFIATQPVSRTVTNGEPMAFSVVAEGSPVLAYQWSQNGAVVVGATGAVLSLPSVSYAARGDYQVRVTNGVGSVTSIVASLVVLVPPTISGIAPQSIPEDGATASLPFVIDDVDSGVGGLVLSAGSSDVGLVPLSGIVFAGSGSNRTVRVSPATNGFGAATVLVRVTDGGGLSAVSAFVVTVSAVNDVPTLDAVPPLTISEDAGPQTVRLSGISSGAPNETNGLTITVSSSNPGLVASPGAIIHPGSATTNLFMFTPSPNSNGTTTLTVSVDDGGSSNNIVVRSFVVTVSAVNDGPTLSAFAEVVLDENTVSEPIAFTVGDVETAAGALAVSAVSTDVALFPAGSFGLGGSGANRTLVLTPGLNRFGSALVTVRVADGEGGEVARSFAVSVVQTVFPPGIAVQPLSQTVTNGGAATFSITTTGSLPMLYQWKYRGLDLPGATNRVLTLPVVGVTNAGAYTMVATNAVGSAVSDAAVLRVLVSPMIGVIARNGSVVEIAFISIAGLSYTLEFSDAPEGVVWNQAGTVVGTGGSLVVSDSGAVVASRIYRVRVE